MTTPLEKWVEEQAKLTCPDNIYWCDGSEEEAHRLVEIGIKKERIDGSPVFHELNHNSFPNSYLHRSHPSDVARTEHLTYVSYPDKENAGPNNNWMEPGEAKEKLTKLFTGSMRGRTMYVLPYMMGHPENPYAKACVQLTDSCYVAINMRIMTRMGSEITNKIGNSDKFVRGLHSIGDLDPKRRFIMHFPLENLVWSVGSGYGGNALLGKKCFSLRIASWLGHNEGWLAEHMIIIGIEDPNKNIHYVVAALPSLCGKTNLAMLESSLPGYKIWTLGDDIAWLEVGHDGRLWAINPEAGFFGVASGTSMKSNPNMMLTLKAGKFYPTLFTNVGLDSDTNGPWWEGMDGPTPTNILDWQGNKWTPTSGTKASHPNARFTVSISQCPTVSPEFANPKGVPISAIIFGGRRSKLIPLVYESFNWQHGVFSGVRMGSETTAAAMGKEGQLRRDPMAMLPFCGYNMADYFRHWLNMGKKIPNPPKIFFVNWFKLDENGNYLWPGYRENIRILKWITERVNNKAGAVQTSIGLIPKLNELELSNLNIPKQNLEKLFEINPDEWTPEMADIKNFLEKFGNRIPQEIWDEFNKMKESICLKSL